MDWQHRSLPPSNPASDLGQRPPPSALGLTLILLLAGCAGPVPMEGPSGRVLERIAVAPSRTGFVQLPSGRPFVPWGFNYDHDETGRLLEDYWDGEWPKVVEDFREMRQLGANVVRVHLQFGRFLRGPNQLDQPALDRLAQLLRLAERTGLYLNLTGLGCYHKADVPPWYDALDEAGRWAAQATFWRAVAGVGRNSPAVFCYDLMNEPVAPHQTGVSPEWLGPPFAGKHFVQWISREARGRDHQDVARQWIRHLTAAIRSEDSHHLITVGLVDWSLPRPGLDSGFHPEIVAPELDFLSVHIYPESQKLEAALETVRAFAVGKPVVVEEIFPLRCRIDELDEFYRRAGGLVSGWIGFYWGRTLDECRQSTTMTDAITAQWLDWFRKQSVLDR